MNTATTVNCPLCGLTVLIREPDPAAAVVAAVDALEQHITNHRAERPKPRDAGARLFIPARPAIPSQRPGVCGAGVTPCGAPARLYPGGWRCDEHIQTKRQETP